MRLRVAVFGTLGAIATLLGAMFVLAPDLALGVQPVRAAVDALSTDPRLVMLGATLVVGLYVAIAARSTSGEEGLDAVSVADRQFERVATNPPEGVTDDRRRQTAAALDATIDRAVADGGADLREVRDVLTGTAESAYASHANVTRSRAQHAIATGAWTADDVAAAFLTGDDGPTATLYSRIRLWLTPAAERERRIERTVAAIEAIQGDRE
jgi:hypothetical protein